MKKSLIAILLLLLLLTSCKSPGDVGDNIDPSGFSADAAVWSSAGGAFKQAHIPAPDSSLTVLYHGGDIYAVTRNFGASEPSRFEIWRNNSELFYVPDSGELSAVDISGEGIWILEGELVDSIYKQRLKLLSFSGELLHTIDTADIPGLEESILRIVCAPDRLLLQTDDGIFAISTTGELLSSCELPFDQTALVISGDGVPYAVKYSESGADICRISEKTLEPAFSLQNPEAAIFSGGEEHFLITSFPDGLYSLKADGESSPILIWEDCGLTPYDVRKVYPLPNGEFLYWDVTGLSRLSPADPSELVTKTELVLAAVSNADWIKATAADFNRHSPDCNVIIKDYSENGAVDIEKAVTRLNTDILSGKYPDLIMFSDLSPFPYIKKGYLLDLYPLIDSDPDISRGDIAILDKLQYSGKVYYLSSTFNIETLVALDSEFGNAYGWTLDKYLELERSRPLDAETLYNTTKPQFLRQISSRYINAAVDWKTGDCDFDNDIFISILEASARVKENPEPENPAEMDFTYPSVRVASGTLVATATWVDSIGKLAFEEKMANYRLSFIGWPTVDGSCGSDIYVSPPVGICSQSSYPDAAWEFMKFTLTNVDIESPGRLPAYMPYLQAQAEKAMRGELTLDVKMTSEDVDRFFALLSEIENVAIYDEKILGIIEEEASAFFAGHKTAKETAALVQSRVQLYVSEQQ